ncbi:transporter substrate-binding protein [Marinobacter flavimaris]|uniref:transporter substrate-binding protein n=1 Tax=Marinobacter flavimaris TaxID=262076 RepID=UPI0030D90209|nr:transporter substrate-binding protein [Gammaproteobacteria bacterium]|tara:strand:- start:34566 stop:35708 length:1143 start_codon:yes stop_codon:yes gene_type:complete
MSETVKVGLLVSSNGTYQDMGRSTLAGLRNAITEINEDPAFEFTIVPEEQDPRGELNAYAGCLDRLIESGAKHIFGTTTSASRKEIIPDLERANRMLWYSCPYEGYECSENVLYLGGCPNQNLLPLMQHAIANFGARACLVGSNYVWGWESNRIAREIVETAAGEVITEKYYRFGDTGFDTLIETIIRDRPGFVLNNLVGQSSYHFLRQLSAACLKKGIRIPVLSCNFTESELPRIQGADSIRLLSCGAFFESVAPSFVAKQSALHGRQPFSHYYTAAYISMHLFATARQRVGHDDPEAIADALYRMEYQSLLGDIKIAEHNNHLSLPSFIAEAKGNRFELVLVESGSIAADPYLVQSNFDVFRTLAARSNQGNFLRLVK